MKGLLYAGFTLNKAYLIGAGIAAAAAAAIGALLQVYLCDDLITPQAQLLLPMISVVIAGEWCGRDIEKNLKNRFTDYTLAAGVSKNMFVLTCLAENILTLVFSYALTALTLLVYSLAGADVDGEDFVMFFCYALIVFAVEWMCTPLTLLFKSAEKAGLLLGVFLGFGIVFPIVIMIKGEISNFYELIVKLISSPLPTVAGVCAGLYALFYLLSFFVVKRGDLC